MAKGLVIFFLLASLVLIFWGILKGKKEEERKQETFVPAVKEIDEESLSIYFEKEFSEKVFEGESALFLNDPFVEICSETPADDFPAVTSNTVCFR